MSVVECLVSIRNRKCLGPPMRRLLSTALIVLACLLPYAALRAAEPAVPPPPEPRHASHVMAEAPEPLYVVLLLGGVVASLILIRGPALRRARQTVKRMPGDAR
jgi:hypothetical protein